MGAVLRATSLLPAIKRKYPSSHITWITDSPGAAIFRCSIWVDQVFETSFESMLELKGREFDVAFVIDKSTKAAGILESFAAKKVYGFRKDPRSGSILPANSAAEYLWKLGLDDDEKFFRNEKPETVLMAEALELDGYDRDGYQLELSEEEKVEAGRRRRKWAADKWLVGINTGCSPMIAYRKFSVSYTRNLIREMLKNPRIEVVLLGGPSEKQRNEEIASGLPVHLSCCTRGVRDGIVSTEACDVVVSGDSFGMHMAIALKKWVVAWFGPTCSHEIDLFERGVKVHSQAGCGPCWKRDCEKQTMCYDLVDSRKILAGIERGLKRCAEYSCSKPPLSEISY